MTGVQTCALPICFPVTIFIIACLIMEGAEFSEHVINGVERPIKPAELFSVVLHILAGDSSLVDGRDTSLRTSMQMKGA